jgi:repressor LexA
MPPPAPRPEPANDVIEIPLHGRSPRHADRGARERRRCRSRRAARPGEHYRARGLGRFDDRGRHLDGDYALVRRGQTARDGEIVVALVRDEEATLKYLHHENGMIRLDPANALYQPQYFRGDEVQVQGKLAGLLRRYH